jgi:hypothetical protein
MITRLIRIAILLPLLTSVLGVGLWTTGAELDYKNNDGSGHVTLNITEDIGISYKWNKKKYTVRVWTSEEQEVEFWVGE